MTKSGHSEDWAHVRTCITSSLLSYLNLVLPPFNCITTTTSAAAFIGEINYAKHCRRRRCIPTKRSYRARLTRRKSRGGSFGRARRPKTSGRDFWRRDLRSWATMGDLKTRVFRSGSFGGPKNSSFWRPKDLLLTFLPTLNKRKADSLDLGKIVDDYCAYDVGRGANGTKTWFQLKLSPNGIESLKSISSVSSFGWNLATELKRVTLG